MSGPSTRAARATYHPQSGARISEGLARARRPFRTANAITGALIFGFATSVYLYSIRAVAQDDFSDLEAPSIEQRQGVRSIEDEQRERERIKNERVREWENNGITGGSSLPSLDIARGERVVEQSGIEGKGLLDGKYGKSVVGLLAEQGVWSGKGSSSALIPGAPNVDRIGTIWDKRSNEGKRLV